MRTPSTLGYLEPLDYADARRLAEHARSEAMDDLWRGANAAWARLQLSASQRLARSRQRLMARLGRRERAQPVSGSEPGWVAGT